MSNYDTMLSHAKKAVTEVIANLATENPRFTIMDLAARIDDLNKAWDDTTDALMRQRDARDKTIFALHARLAESEGR